MYYKVPDRAYIKKSIQEGCNPLLPNYVGHIGSKPLYEADGPLKSMDDIIILTERCVREVTVKEWGKLRDTPHLGVPLLKIVGGLYKNPA
jgi:hypothetical protein